MPQNPDVPAITHASSRRSHSYTAYEMGIRSEVPLPELMAGEPGTNGIAIGLRALDRSEQLAPRSSKYFVGETAGVGTFLVRDGREIIVDPAPGVDEALLRTILLGPIMAVLLRQRGLAVLHASGIAMNGGAIAFLGKSGCGKSTLAEAFYDRGYGVVTDDVLAIHLDETQPHVFPGYPSIKLFPDAAAFLGCDARGTRLVHSQTEKRAHSAALRFPQGSLPMRRMYVLAIGDSNELEPIDPREAFVDLVRNSRAVTLLTDSTSREEHLHQCAQLAEQVPAFRLRRRPVLSSLPDLVRLVAEAPA